MPLTYCTLIGADTSVLLAELASLSEDYPFVEWGFLYSPKRQGLPGRYPSIATLQRAFDKLPPKVHVALHVCGQGVRDLVAGERLAEDLVRLVAGRNGRVQLNFNLQRGRVSLDDISQCLDRHPTATFITQHNAANESAWRALRSKPNHAVLFDASGGEGVAREDWPAPLDVVSCGYAGGLGPVNLAEQLPRIEVAAVRQSYWIDMESSLRDDLNRFDLDTAKACLAIAEGFVRTVETKPGFPALGGS